MKVSKSILKALEEFFGHESSHTNNSELNMDRELHEIFCASNDSSIKLLDIKLWPLKVRSPKLGNIKTCWTHN